MFQKRNVDAILLPLLSWERTGDDCARYLASASDVDWSRRLNYVSETSETTVQTPPQDSESAPETTVEASPHASESGPETTVKAPLQRL